jgi:flagellar protein FliS
MISSSASLAYRKAALQQASAVGLVIALYDTLVGDLGRAAVAIETNDIEGRCAELTHGFKVLQQLDLMLDMENGGNTAVQLRRFYSHLRGYMLKAQFKLSAAILHEQIRMMLVVREAWQELDTREHEATVPGTNMGPAYPTLPCDAAPQASEAEDRLSHTFSCSG